MLTELDKKVGAAKGWKHCPWGAEKKRSFRGEIEPIDEGFIFANDRSECHISEDVCHWSERDEDAFDLVDEPALASFDFCLMRRGKMWLAYFHHIPSAHTMDGEGPTRPEAICRAYIAAREWMREKKG